MTRSMTISLLILCLCAGAAQAQTAGRRPVRRASGVTGVELGLEGALQAPRGGQLRWLMTAYEVVGLRDLRPAPEATISLATSFDPGEQIEVTTDEYGRAVMELTVPDDAPDSFRAVIMLRSALEVQRRFELNVTVTEPRHLQIYSARDQIQPRGSVRVFGRLLDRRSGRPLAGQEVSLHLRDHHGRQLGAPVVVRTGDGGLYAHTFRAPPEIEEGALTVRAEAGDEEHRLRDEVSLRIAEPQAPPLLLAVAPEAVVVEPRSRVAVRVMLRTPSGRPVPNARVALAGTDEDDPGGRAVTDDRGAARLTWRAPHMSTGFHDYTVSVTAVREGYGQTSGSALVRVAATDWAAALAVEGGALIPSLGGRIWVRVTGIDGHPAGEGTPVEVRGPRLPSEGLRATTDADGLATFDVTLGEVPAGTTDRCGGEGATAIEVRAGASGSDRAELSACVPLDPDGAARVRATPPLVVAGHPVHLEVERTQVARGLPVSLSVLARRGDVMEAVASRVLPSGESAIDIDLPPGVTGHLVIRARPLSGDERHEVRGGSTAVWVVPAPPLDARVGLEPEEDVVRIGLLGQAQGRHSAYLVALPVDEARALAERLRGSTTGPLGDLRRPTGEAGEALLAAALAASVIRDAAAPAVLRPGEGLVPVPAPEEPVAQGLLRDPWRSRARFVTGRLALIFQAIEREVAQALPDRIDDVAVRERGRWTFNSEIVEAVASSDMLGGAGATGLGGEPLTIEALQSLDRAFTYDNVARRITRERLFRLIVALRAFVQENGFDLPWSRLGDPSTWLRGLPGTYMRGGGNLRREDLVDGWGRPFELRRAPGGRTRFNLVAPLGGWEVVSAGPDGRFGNGDDLWNPTARVLPEGSEYARAVGEDVLVARLQGVELGRATVEMLLSSTGIFRGTGGVPAEPEAASVRLAQSLWTQLPAIIEPDPEALALRRPTHPGDGALGRVVALPGAGATVPLGLDEEPRTWGLVAYVWSPAGASVVGLDTAIGGAPLIVEGRFPDRLRVDEPVTVDLELTNVTDQVLEVRPRIETEGVAQAEAPPAVRLAPGTAAGASVRLRATGPGPGRVELALAGAGGRDLRRVAFDLVADEGSRPVRLRAGAALVGRRWRTRLRVPGDAVRPRGRVVVLAPRGLASDPALSDVRRRDPALLAWYEALNGRSLGPELRAALLRAQGPNGVVDGDIPALSTSCAVVAWSGADPEDEDARLALSRARSALTMTEPIPDDDATAGGLRTGAVVLAALASGGVPELFDGAAGSMDRVVRLLAQLRPALRRAIHLVPEEPSLLARAAAALLLADPRDGHGRAMLERVEQHLEEVEGGALLVVPSEARAGGTEALSATLALALAAHQAGRGELADRLLRGALTQENVVTRTGGELTFWHLAAAAYGVMGTGTPERVTVSVDGDERAVDLSEGYAVVPFEARAGRSSSVTVERIGGPGLLVRAEVVMGRSFTGDEEGPLALELLGEPGRAGRMAALELSVQARGAVEAPVIDLQLPAGVDAEESLLETVRMTAGVRDAEPRRPGFLRIWLEPMADGVQTSIPLPIRWSVRGRLHGLGAMAYPRAEPQAMTVLPPRTLNIE